MNGAQPQKSYISVLLSHYLQNNSSDPCPQKVSFLIIAVDLLVDVSLPFSIASCISALHIK
jgi:hypothetical protein